MPSGSPHLFPFTDLETAPGNRPCVYTAGCFRRGMSAHDSFA